MSIDLSPIEEPICLPRLEGFRNVSTSIGYKGEAVRLWIPESIAQKWQGPGKNSFTRSHREELYPARVLITSLTGSQDCELLLSGAPYPFTQVLPDGDILVAAPRCWRFQDGTSEAALV